LPAFLLFASLIRDQKGVTDGARPVRPLACIRMGGSGLRFLDVAMPVAKLAKLSEFEGQQKMQKMQKFTKFSENGHWIVARGSCNK
jgi:hypothetical protein